MSTTVRLRMTRQRKLIMDLLSAVPGHPDVRQIHRLAREREPNLNLSTVYRTMTTLKRLGLVSELHLEEEHHHYEPARSDDHHHLVCSRCGGVAEFQHPLTAVLAKAVGEQNGFRVTGSRIEMVGLCARCRAEEG